MAHPHVRPMRADEHDAVAALICESTNAWYRRNRGFDVFPAGPASCLLFPETYELMDPGCCAVAEDPATGALMGSCFYHPRPTHVSLGIMNVHPAHFGKGVASRLLKQVTDLADAAGKPTRLVSSAMNLDSFSLYTRAGFVPRAAFADMQVSVGQGFHHPDQSGIRPARPDDVPTMASLEEELAGIRRDADHAFFVANRQRIWHTLVHEDARGAIDGFLVSVAHPGSNMLGPGIMRGDDTAAALIAAQLNHHQGRAPVFLIPLGCPALQQQIYAWGGRNLEIHFVQARGAYTDPTGVVMPTFMPETG